MIFAELLKSEMETAGLSQKDLAEKSGLTQAAISRYVANKREPTWAAVQKLAAALGVPVTAFLEGDGGGSVSQPAPAEPPKPKKKGGKKGK